MRITACAVSAILLAGCSWAGGSNSNHGYDQGYNSYGNYGYGSSYQSTGLRGGSAYGYGQQANPCGQAYAVQTVTQDCVTYGGTAGTSYRSGYRSGYSGGGAYGATAGTAYAGQSGYTYGTGGAAYGSGCQPMPACSYQTGYSGGYYQQSNTGYYARPTLRPRARYNGGLRSPLGLEFGIGTEFDVAGNFKRDLTKKDPALVDPDLTSAVDDVAFGDVYDPALKYTLGLTYALDSQNVLLGQVGYAKAEGNTVALGQLVNPGVPIDETLYADTSDLEQWTVEGGLRHYFGGFRPGYGRTAIVPYVAGTVGATYTDDITVTQYSETRYADNTGTGGTDDRLIDTFYESGWAPTASALVGAEWRVGQNVGLGVETGVRWSGNLDGNQTASDDRWTVPLTLRGRLAF